MLIILLVIDKGPVPNFGYIPFAKWVNLKIWIASNFLTVDIFTIG